MRENEKGEVVRVRESYGKKPGEVRGNYGRKSRECERKLWDGK